MNTIIAVQVGDKIRVRTLNNNCDDMVLLVTVANLSGIVNVKIPGLTDVNEMSHDELIPLLGPDGVQVIGTMVISNGTIEINQGELI